VTYLLDTNACIALINGKPEEVRERFERACSNGDRMTTSSVVVYELWYGVRKSQREGANARRLATFLSGPVDLLRWDDGDAHAAGEIRASLERAGTPIGAHDVLIASQAIRRRFTLVTANGREFSRVPGLRWEDWATAA
jgi:tRNA(fMet)-specific endonuclease VapC